MKVLFLTVGVVSAVVMVFVVVQYIQSEQPFQEQAKLSEEAPTPKRELEQMSGEQLKQHAHQSTAEKSTAQSCEHVLATSPFYRVDRLQALQVEKDLRKQGNNKLADKLQAISCVPQGIWVSGQNAQGTAEQTANDIAKAKQQGKIPVFVVYDGPQHAIGAWRHIAPGQTYTNWIQLFAKALGKEKAWVIFEPDALALSFNYTEVDQQERLAEIKSAVRTIKKENPRAKVYIDAGHSKWRQAEDIARVLEQAGVFLADGFSLNVSNHQAVQQEILYGMQIAELLENMHFVVDVGQTGTIVTEAHWCNAQGRALGQLPTKETGNFLVDALLWVKPPGESDGLCNNGPPAGKFWLDYALDLIGKK